MTDWQAQQQLQAAQQVAAKIDEWATTALLLLGFWLMHGKWGAAWERLLALVQGTAG